MNKEVQEIVRKECVKHNRHLQIPGIYKHFKLIKDNEEMLYAVTNVSIPLHNKDYADLINRSEGFYLMHHTELEFGMSVIRVGDRYYHNKDVDSNMLVMYTALYGNRESYMRPLPMFLSKTDTVKYPKATQKYRLEEV